jgi:hypothetical protein
MQRCRLSALTLWTTLATAAIGCGDDPVPDAGQNDGGTNDGSTADTGTDGGTRPDVGPTPDTGPRDTGTVNTTCNNPPLTPPVNATCETTAGTNGAILIRGDIVAPEGLLENGHLLIGADGKIACAACDCSADPVYAAATVVACAKGVVTPGLINAHDHITFTETAPTPPPDPETRYEHRHQWRRGQDGLPRIPSVSNTGGDSGIWWGELRHLMSGATSINGSGGAAGLLRNLDNNRAPNNRSLQEGLDSPNVFYSTFPLGDSGGERLATGCAYPDLDSPTNGSIVGAAAYTPHIAEGIDPTARNEWVCLTQGSPEMPLINSKTGIIHGIGLLAQDFAVMASRGSTLIWSPRSNIDLYGDTAQTVLAAHSGVRIALGTDWTASGSMNMTRELVCADELNKRNFGNFFSDRELLDMATINAATALGADDKIGALKVGYFADVSIYNGTTNAGYRAVIDAQPQDVVLVLRGGKPLYGDLALMGALPETQTGCEVIDVCTFEKSVCSQRDTGLTIAQHRAAIAANAYDLFFCGAPPMEPTCIPYRRGEYMGVAMAGDQDGDGVMDAMDNCPNIFNPVRPLDTDGNQANGDQDDLGDACDICPTDPGTASCTPPDPNDVDKDGVPNADDNCPDRPNMLQENQDGDQYGDICDQCPTQSNLGGVLCSTTVYSVKQASPPPSNASRFENLIVTAVAPNGYFAQIAPGDPTYDATLGPNYSGIFVFTSAAGLKPARGDRIDLDATPSVFFGQTQLTNGTFTVRSSNNTLPPAVSVMPAEVATGGARAAQLEGVLVEVQNVTVTDIMPAPDASETAPTYEYVVNTSLRINDVMYRTDPFPAVNQPIGFIRGILRFANNNSKLEPRDAADVGVPEALVAIEPGTAFVQVGTNGVPPGGLRVRISRPASAPIVINLASSDPAVSVPATVTVASSSTSANIPVNVTGPAAAPVTITATYDGRMAQATLRVYSDATVRTVESVTLDRNIIPINGGTNGRVTIQVPAGTNGSTVSLSATPPGLLQFPATVTIAAGELSAVFAVTTATATGNGTLEARIGASAQTVAFQVTNSVRRAPLAGELIITEIHRNPSASSEKFFEWFELYNPTGDELEVNGMEVVDNVGNAILNAPNAFVPAGGYAVIAYTSDLASNGGVTAIAEYGATDMQLANADDIITLRVGGMVIDTVDWGMGWPGANGVAMCLRAPYPADNNVVGAWGTSVGTFGTTNDQGSPGVGSNATNCP